MKSEYLEAGNKSLQLSPAGSTSGSSHTNRRFKTMIQHPDVDDSSSKASQKSITMKKSTTRLSKNIKVAQQIEQKIDMIRDDKQEMVEIL
jgi:hypothetical protein